jgi:hypothetical protein
VERRALLTLAGCALLATAGLGLGAARQHEASFHPDTFSQLQAGQREASGNSILLTGLLAAGGATAAGLALSRQPPRAKALGGLALFVGGYVLVNLAQTAWPNLTAIESQGTRIGYLSVNLVAFHGPGVASVFLPIFAGIAGSVMLAGWGVRRLLASPTPGPRLPMTSGQLLRAQLAASALAVPFLAIAFWGLVRLLLAGQHGVALVLLPVAALACLALAGIAVWKAWHLGQVARDARLAIVAEESWLGLGRAEAGLAAGLILLAALGSLMPPTESALLEPGLTFSTTLRGHILFLASLLVPLAPSLLLQGPAMEALRRKPPAEPGSAPMFWTGAAAIAATFAAAGIATWLPGGALWPWLAATLAASLAAYPLLPRIPAGSVLATAAFALWAAGNSYTATFRSDLGTQLQYGSPAPGALALLRLAAAALAGLAIARILRGMAAGRPSFTIPLAVGGGVCAAGAALLVLPLDIWPVSSFRGAAVAQGTLLASQDAAVQAAMHALTFVLLCGWLLAVAAAVRPEWFRRHRRGQPAPAGAMPART